MSAAPDADRPGDDARLLELLRAMRAVHGGDPSARAPQIPGRRDALAELTRLFNAIAERVETLEAELGRLRPGLGVAAAEPGGGAAASTPIILDTALEQAVIPEQYVPALAGSEDERERRPAIVVVEAARAAGPAAAHGPMAAAARTALRGLGGVWDRAAVLLVDAPRDVRAAAAGHRVVSALLDARCPAPLLHAVVAALESEVPGVPMLCFAPDDDQAAFDRAGALTRGRARAAVVRSSAQAVERLTLHWLTEAPVAADPLAEPADPNYGQIRFEGEKVLVVDDDVRNVFAMVSALELYGLTALTADNGPEAVDLLLRNPDVGIVLMDLMMPGLDGYATTARIRAHPEFADLPIIAVTAWAAPGDRERSLAAGTNEHVTKPVEVDHLLALIKRLIKR